MCAASAAPHEVTLVAPTLDSRFVPDLPRRLIGDRAYDADPLDMALARLGVEMIAPHRRGRVRPKTQDGRPLRRYRRRWKIERLFAWLGNFRRLVVRYELNGTRSTTSASSTSVVSSSCFDAIYEMACRN